jgi:hypothetical protein
VYQDRVLLSIEAPEHDRHGKQSGPWGSADFRRPMCWTKGRITPPCQIWAAQCLEFRHGVEGAL